jgi:hypothetical protein
MSRLAPMRRLLAPTLALGLGALCAVVVASCGGGNSQLLSGDNANQLNTALDRIASDANRGACSSAASLADSIANQLNQQSNLDRDLKSALIQGFQRLKVLAGNPSTCLTLSTTTTTPTTTTATTQAQTTKTTPTQTQTTPTQTTPTQTTPTTTTNGSGGVGGGPGL